MRGWLVAAAIILAFGVFYHSMGAALGAEFKSLTRDESIVRMVLQEANNEPFMGMVAVAATVLDRVTDRRWPNSDRGVVYQPYQYTAMSLTLRRYTPRQVEIARIAVSVARLGIRPCGERVFWYHTLIVSPSWDKRMTEACTIGNHIFFRE